MIPVDATARKTRAFISYAREDAQFADQLAAALDSRGLEPLIDRRDIEHFEAWWERIEQLIVSADAIVFVASPDSVRSDVCRQEIEYAAGLNKRIAPVLARDIDWAFAPAILQRINHFAATDADGIEQAAGALVTFIHSEIGWLREHTRIGELARRWEAMGSSRHLLLRGADIETTEGWRDRHPSGAPEPTATQLAFVSASRAAAGRRQRYWLGGALLTTVVFAALALVSYMQRNQALETESRFLAGFAHAERERGRTSDAVALSWFAVPHTRRLWERPLIPEAVTALYEAMWENKETAVLIGHKDWVRGALFADQGSTVLTFSEDKAARIWTQIGGVTRAVLTGHDDAIIDAALSPDGRFVATASIDGTARVWTLSDGKETLSLRGHEDVVRSVAWSRDGAMLVTASNDRTARVWDARTGEVRLILKGHDRQVSRASFSPAADHILTASDDLTARVWDASTGVEIAKINGALTALYSPDGSTILTTTSTVAALWDARSGKNRAVLRGHTSSVLCAVFAPDGRLVVTGSMDHTARLWDAATGKEQFVLRRHTGSVNAAAFSPDSRTVLTASDDSTMSSWEVRSGIELGRFGGHDDGLQSVAFAPDGRHAVTASLDRTARIWDVRPRVIAQIPDGTLYGAALSPDATLLATGRSDGAVWFVDARTGSEAGFLKGHGGPVYSTEFSRDGATILTASQDGSARLWSTATRSQVQVFEGQGEAVSSAGFSPDGRRILTASADKTARIWSARDGAELLVLRGHEGPVTRAAYSPDGTVVVTASEDRKLMIWDARTGVMIRSLEGHTSEVIDASFSPDGRAIVSASHDDTARIWDARSGQTRALLRGHGNKVVSARFSSDGKRVGLAKVRAGCVRRRGDGTCRPGAGNPPSSRPEHRSHLPRA